MANLTMHLLKVSNSRRVDRHFFRYPGKLQSKPLLLSVAAFDGGDDVLELGPHHLVGLVAQV